MLSRKTTPLEPLELPYIPPEERATVPENYAEVYPIREPLPTISLESPHIASPHDEMHARATLGLLDWQESKQRAFRWRWGLTGLMASLTVVMVVWIFCKHPDWVHWREIWHQFAQAWSRLAE